MPTRYSPPLEMEEAIIIAETAEVTLDVLDELPERLIHDIIMYKGVKKVIEYGGQYEV